MASIFSLRISPLFTHVRICELGDRIKLYAKARHIANNDTREQYYFRYSRSKLAYVSTQKHHLSTFQVIPSRLLLPRAISSTVASSENSDQTKSENHLPVSPVNSPQVYFNRVNCLVWILHEAASSFSLAIETLELNKKNPEIAMAWVGVDSQAWHKHIAYQVAVYALLKAVTEVELVLSQKYNNPSLVQEILSQMTISLGENIENHLKIRQPKLVQWFRTVELSRISGLFIPLLNKWAIDYAGSGVAGIILAISCCVAAKKISPGRLYNALLAEYMENVTIELMVLAHNLVSVEKLHQLATEAGFQEGFFIHFGKKVLPGKDIEEVEFWIGLVHRKLSTAFLRESIISEKQTFCNEVQEKGLATLGLFAYLGRETRLFLSKMGVKDQNDQVKDFLSYLECGSLFMHPEFSSLSGYQLFMEVVTDEIGWLDFYAPFYTSYNKERARSMHHALEVEQELVLYTVFTVCYDIFSGFAHFSNSSKQQLDENLLEFLLHSQSLLSTCLENYWAVYDRSGELPNVVRESSYSTLSTQTLRRTNSSALLDAQPVLIDIMESGGHQEGSNLSKIRRPTEVDPQLQAESLPKSLFKKSTIKLMSASADVWMGTQLLLIDILDATNYLRKHIQGRKLTERERKKIEKTLADLVSLVPITILMLIPITAVGHAALLAAIQKYTPKMIPSPYSPERLDVVKQLKRAQNMEVQTYRSTTSNEDAST